MHVHVVQKYLLREPIYNSVSLTYMDLSFNSIVATLPAGELL